MPRSLEDLQRAIMHLKRVTAEVAEQVVIEAPKQQFDPTEKFQTTEKVEYTGAFAALVTLTEPSARPEPPAVIWKLRLLEPSSEPYFDLSSKQGFRTYLPEVYDLSLYHVHSLVQLQLSGERPLQSWFRNIIPFGLFVISIVFNARDSTVRVDAVVATAFSFLKDDVILQLVPPI